MKRYLFWGSLTILILLGGFLWAGPAIFPLEDERIGKGIDATVAAMKKYKKPFDYKIYPGAKHSFMSDNRKSRYHPVAAKEAWSRTLVFFGKHLKGS